MSEDLDNYSFPSSDNDSTRDYKDKEDIIDLYPEDESSSLNVDSVTRSTEINTPPMMLRLENQIRDILGEVSDEYATFLSKIIYDWKYVNRPIPSKYKVIVAYIDKRMKK